MKKTIYLGIAALMCSAALSSCQADMDTPALDVPEADIKANITLLELKTAYEGLYNQPIYMPGTWRDADGRKITKGPDGNLIVEGVDDSGNHNGMTPGGDGSFTEGSGEVKIAGGDPVYVHGRVVSSDASGNIYKSLVIQDETAALAFSINQASLYNEYRLGQEMVVDMTGLYIGYYSGLQQIGYPGEDYNGVPQLSFMSYDYWLARAQYNGLPDPEYDVIDFGSATPYPENRYYMLRFNDFDLLNNGTLPELQSQLVEFRNVHFKFEAGEIGENGESLLPYSTYQENANRTLVDANGKTLTVRNSGYSNFYNRMIPVGSGTVRGILSYYQDSWQLILRDVRDVIIGKQGDKSDPFTVSEVISGEYEGMTGWTAGYVVGSVKAGVSAVSADTDVIFGKDAEMDTNVLIAASPDETDWRNCIVVELPQNTLLRYFVNLLDNPGVYKKQLAVSATLGRWLGMPGVTGSVGNIASFTIDGAHMKDPGDAPAPSGSGTEADPYNVSYVIESTVDETGVWVEGYVAGFVSEGNYTASGCVFAASGSGNNFENSSNIILSANAVPLCNMANSVPAQLTTASRPTLGLKNNPAIFAKKVKVKCRIADYLGTRGIRQISEVVVE